MKNIIFKRDDFNQSQSWEYNIVNSDEVTMISLKNKKSRFLVLYLIVFAMISVLLIGRMLYLNFVLGAELTQRSVANYKRVFVEKAMRGLVYDDNGNSLVFNTPYNSAAIIPADINKDVEIRKQVFAEMAELLDISADSIEAIYSENKYSFSPIKIKTNISHDEEIIYLAKFSTTPGIYIKKDFRRDYLYDNVFSHVLGYVGVVDSKTLQENEGAYYKDSLIGKTGVEAFYETKLKGKDSQKEKNVNSKGSVILDIPGEKPLSGGNITLTLDSDLQTKTYSALTSGIKRAKAVAGCAVVLDVKTGGVKAMVSLPDFNPNIFRENISSEEWNNLINSSDFPFLNRCISGVYPPGSVYKMVTSSAILQENVVNASTKVWAPGQLVIKDQYNPDKVYIHRDWKSSGHGYLTVRNAIEESADTFFYTVTGGFEGFVGLGINKLVQYSDVYNLGRVLGIDMPGEKAGLLPTPDWKQQTINERWSTGDTYNMSIGQGYLLTTPLQIAYVTSLVASDGDSIKPHVIANSENLQPKNNFPVDRDNLEIIKEGLRLVVTGKNGTAKSLQSFPVAVAGKTGTAQFQKNKREHAWFTSYAPYDNPEIVVTVLIEEAGEGSSFALPVAREILQAYFQ